jgi:selenocysteine lyase/cysteine desulfurase
MSHEPPLHPSLFDVGSRLWLMHCAEGPIPRATAKVLAEFLERELHPWLLRWPEDFVRITDDVHRLAACIVNARADDITITTNTSTALGTIAHGYPWKTGDEVLVPLGEFPSNTVCWRALAARGVSFREVALWKGQRSGETASWDSPPPSAAIDPEQALIDAIGPSTRVISASWVRFQDGVVLDLARLGAACRERNATLVIDGIQGAGALECEASAVDAFATGGHKGLLTPQGQGFLFTHERLRERLVPMGSWLSVGEGDEFGRASSGEPAAWRTDGRRLEAGGLALLMLVGLRESLQLIGEAGVGRIARHVASLRAQLIAGLARIPQWAGEAERLAALDAKGRLGPIVSLHHGTRGPAGLDAIVRRGIADGIYSTVRDGFLRLAWHGYHSSDDVDRTLRWLAG